MGLKTTRWDAADGLETDEDMALFLEIILEDPIPEVVRGALGAIARAKGIQLISKETGIGLKQLQRAFLRDDIPNPKTVKKLLKALRPKADAKAIEKLPRSKIKQKNIA